MMNEMKLPTVIAIARHNPAPNIEPIESCQIMETLSNKTEKFE